MTTYCDRCPTQYSSTMRPEGSRCHDLSLPLEHVDVSKVRTDAEWDEIACHGICRKDNPWCEVGGGRGHESTWSRRQA